MGGMWIVLTFSFLHLCLLSPGAGYSFKNCTAHGSLKLTGLKVLCFQRGFLYVPPYIPHNTKFLDISGNHISHLKKGDFPGLIYMTELNVSCNQVDRVDNGTFEDLVSLRLLNLTQNKLKVLSGEMFRGLTNLTALQLGCNCLHRIDLSAFQLVPHICILNLSGNALQQLEKTMPALLLSNLKQLYLASNQFSQFNTDSFYNISLGLTTLDMSANPFSHFTITKPIFPQLACLSLNYAGVNRSLEWEVGNHTFLHQLKNLCLNGIHMDAQGIKPVITSLTNSSLENLQLNQVPQKDFENTLQHACHLLPRVRTLSLENNNFTTFNLSLLTRCSKLINLYLSHNLLKNLSEISTEHMPSLELLCLSFNQLEEVPSAITHLPTLKSLDLSNNGIEHIKQTEFSNLNKLTSLNLVNNNILSITGSPFLYLLNLEMLSLGNNYLRELPKSWSSTLSKLQYLDLHANKITYVGNDTFYNLKYLKTVNLKTNSISHIDPGAFTGLQTLESLNIGDNFIHKEALQSGYEFTGMPHLKTLSMFNNFLCYKSTDELKKPPFSELSSLIYLFINSQGPDCMIYIPSNLFKGLHSLRELHVGHLSIDYVHRDTFLYTPKLEYLDISNNHIVSIDYQLFQVVPFLQILHLNTLCLDSLDFIIRANLTRLKFLSATDNKLHTITEAQMKSLPLLRFLDLGKNPFTCSCENAWFLNWSLKVVETQVSNFHMYDCSFPKTSQGKPLADFKTESCILDYDFICFVSSFSFITLTLLVTFFYHFLRWQVLYAYYLFLALLYDKKQRKRPLPRYEYDAFVSYNTHDEPWVFRELLPNLEQDQGWKLCLHHRDFEPGRPIIDNIMDGIYKSRKTICLISRHYLESEWCSREIQVASFRLFDEQKDVLILVFLEDIPACQLSPYHRMRKLVKKRTYLAWPKHEQETRIFWQKVNAALKIHDDVIEENPILAGIE
ncbi:toll-like receptor 13 [Amia ocellicauda]|uniref:toll-like receptor 13 n=1 Tax=Amia ocellicauda TaxID=2972642 RepID=UPI0034649485